MRISVTREDIEAGRRRNPSECPVARALRRAGISHFGVTGMLAIVQTGRNHVPLVLPAQVQEWILDFDWGSAMSPIDFELTLPHEKPGREGQRAGSPPEEEPALAKQGTGCTPLSKGAPKPPRLAHLPRWSISAKELLGCSLRHYRRRRSARGREPTEDESKLVSS